MFFSFLFLSFFPCRGWVELGHGKIFNFSLHSWVDVDMEMGFWQNHYSPSFGPSRGVEKLERDWRWWISDVKTQLFSAFHNFSKFGHVFLKKHTQNHKTNKFIGWANIYTYVYKIKKIGRRTRCRQWRQPQ